MFESLFNRSPEPPKPPSDPIVHAISTECCRAFYLALGEKGFALSDTGISHMLYPHVIRFCPAENEHAQRIVRELARGVRAKIDDPAGSKHLEVPENLKECVEDGYAIYRHFASRQLHSKHTGLFDFKDEAAQMVVWAAWQGHSDETICGYFIGPDRDFIGRISEAVRRLSVSLNASLDDLLPEERLRERVRMTFAGYKDD